MSLRTGSIKGAVYKGTCLTAMITKPIHGGGADGVRFGKRRELIIAKLARGEMHFKHDSIAIRILIDRL